MPKDEATLWRLKALFEKYLHSHCSVSELTEFWTLLANQEDMDTLDPQLQQLWESLHPKNQPAGSSAIKQKTKQLLEQSKRLESNARLLEQRAKTQKKLQRIMAAAIIVVALGVSSYIWLIRNNSIPDPALRFNVKNTAVHSASQNAPTLVLADGRTIDLNQLADGALVSNSGNGLKIQKTKDGQLSYNFQQSSEPSGKNSGVETLNQLITPTGKKYQVVLADGTKAWLNGSSSIQFPSYFDGRQREVTITGEAYFEVAHNAKQPFVVHANGMDIKVLGTHFNVNAYPDEPAIRTTLLEGLVQIAPKTNTDNNSTATRKPVILHPGQQLEFSAAGKTTLVRAADIHTVMSWKQGKFIFSNEDLGSVMRSIARWYNIEVMYDQNQIPAGHVSGEISRSESLDQVLKMLELAEGARFEIKGKTVIVHEIHP